MTDDPLLIALMAAAGLYVGKLWLDDLRANLAGTPNPRALPGATSAPLPATVVAIVGALILLVAETWGEYRLGLNTEQSRITWLFGGYTLVAAVVEEIIFRGFFVLRSPSPAMRWLGYIGASLAFAAIHPFLWRWDGGLIFEPTAKAWFSTGAIFLGSLWFFAVRFMPINPRQSLIPCFAAHAAKNLGVVAIKAFEGYVVGLW